MGDTAKSISTSDTTFFVPGVEISAGGSLNISNNVSLGVGGNASILQMVSMLSENTCVETSGVKDVKNGIEIGGIGGGGNVSVTLSFE